MEKALSRLQFMVVVLAGWMNQRQQNATSICVKRTEYCASNPETVACGSMMINVAD